MLHAPPKSWPVRRLVLQKLQVVLRASIFDKTKRSPTFSRNLSQIFRCMITLPSYVITPKQNPFKANFVAKQTRYQQAFTATMNFLPWDPETDSIKIYGDEEYFGALLKSWEFEPVLKMHSSDLRIVAFKPDGWDPAFKG